MLSQTPLSVDIDSGHKVVCGLESAKGSDCIMVDLDARLGVEAGWELDPNMHGRLP